MQGGKRTGIKLDLATWQAIEWLSGQAGKTWQQWCAKIIESTPADQNVTASVRAAATKALVMATVFSERRGDDLTAMENNALMRNSAALNDSRRRLMLLDATVHGSCDFGCFVIKFGQNEHGRDFVLVENKMRDEQHFILVAGASK